MTRRWQFLHSCIWRCRAASRVKKVFQYNKFINKFVLWRLQLPISYL